jgi:predicted nucleotidyltransferase
VQLEPWPRFSARRLLERLVAGEVDFVVVGGIAAVAHGSATLTGDLDISYAPDEANLDRLGRVLVELGAHLRGVTDDVPFIPDGRTLRRTRVLTLETPAGNLDLLAQPDGAPVYDRLRERADREQIAGVEVLIASLDDLIAMKRAAGRPKDLVAVEELEAIRRLRRELDT